VPLIPAHLLDDLENEEKGKEMIGMQGVESSLGFPPFSPYGA
jgi:hypothetical protein